MKRFGIVLTSLLVIFLGLTTNAAAAQHPAIHITTATLVNGGAAVQVTARFTCRAGAAGLLTVDITQTRGSTTVTAAGQNEGGFTCTGVAQKVSALVTVQAGGGLFRTGHAIAESNVLQCDESDCNSITSTQRVKITR